MPARRDYSGNAVATTLNGGINSTATSIAITDATGWPTGGANGKFYAVINRGGASEEKILVNSRTGTTLTLAASSDRGVDDTTAASHSSGETIEHCITATDADEANALTALADAKGDIVAATAADTWARKAVGTDNYPLVADSSQSDGLAYKQLPTAGIADGAVTAAKLASAVAGNGLTGGGGSALAVQVDSTTIEISADTLRLAATAAGNGLSGGGGSALAVAVDDSTIEVASDQVRIKDGGVTAAKLAAALPQGTLGRARTTTPQTGISGETDLTSLSVAVTAGTSRQIKITAHVEVVQNTSTGSPILKIKEGSTVLARAARDTLEAGYRRVLEASALIEPTAGAHTYKLSLSTSAGTVDTTCASDSPDWILVEDVGAA